MFENVKQEIDDKIKTNGNNEITATRLNGVLQDMMDASAEVIEEVQQSVGTQVEANPTGAATTPLNKIKIGDTNYNIPQTDTSNLATKTELQQGLSGKQDTINDLSEIRTCAAAGATAVQPSATTGLLKNDGTVDTQTAGKAASALQPISGAQENNFGAFDANGGIKDSGCNEGAFIKGVQQNGVDLQKDANGKVNVTVQDGEDGASAYDLYVDSLPAGTTPLSQEAWLASLKANIGAFKFVNTIAAVQTQFENDGVGSIYTSSIDSVTADSTTLSVILLMTTSGLSPEKTYMIATQEVTPATTPASYEFVYAGDLQSAMPSNVLTEDDIINDLTTGGIQVPLSAEQGKVLKTICDNAFGNFTYIELVVEEGGISSANGTDTESSAGNRVRTDGYIDANVINLDAGDGKMYIHAYNSSDGYVGNSGGWLTGINDGYSINNANKYRIVFADANDRSITPSTFESYGFKVSTGGEGYVVRTDKAQEFTTAEKAQARQNIGAMSSESLIDASKLEDNAVTTSKISDNAVVPSKTNFFNETIVHGKNLLYGEWEIGRYDSNGDIQSSYKHMLVPCQPNTTYTLSVTAGNIGNASSYVVLFDTNEGFISDSAKPTDTDKIVFTTTQDAAYIGISAQSSPINIQLELGSERTSYEEPFENAVYKIEDEYIPTQDIQDNSITFNKIAFKKTIVTSTNLLNLNSPQCEEGKYIEGDTGAIKGSSPQTMITPYIEINKQGLYCSPSPIFSGGTGGAVGCAVYEKTGNNWQFKRRLSGQYVYQDGDEGCAVRYTLYLSNRDTTQIEVGASETIPHDAYQEKEIIDPTVLPPSSLSESDLNTIQEYLAEDAKIFPNSLDLLLPTKFYCVKGDTLQLFYKGIVKAIGLENRYVKPTCSVGRQYRRYLEIPYNITDVDGDKPITFKVYDDNENVLGSGSSIIKVLNTPTSPSTEKHILCIGASTTEGGQWVCEAQRRLLASDGTPQGNALSNLVFVGNMEKTLWQQTAHYYGKSGWAWKDFATQGRPAFRFSLHGTGNTVVQGNQYTNNGYTYTVIEPLNTIDGVETIRCSTSSFSNVPSTSGTLTPVSGAAYSALTFDSVSQDSANLFWNASLNRLDFTSYVNQYCNGSIDIVYTMLGVNNMFEDGVEQQEQYVRTFIEQLHSEYPNCVIVLATDALPSMVDMMPGYGASGDTYSNIYKFVCEMHKVYSMYKRLAEEYSSRSTDQIQVEFESWCAQVDSDYNFPLTLKDVNTRNSSVQEPYARNTIHPGDGYEAQYIRGYMQLADAAYRSIVAHLCQ